MDKIRAFLLDLAAAELTGAAYQAVLSIVLSDATFAVSNYSGKIRESLPPYLVDAGLFTRKGKGTAIKYEPTAKLRELRALLAGQTIARQSAALEAAPTVTGARQPDPPQVAPATNSEFRIQNSELPKPAPNLTPWAAGAAAKFLQRKSEQQAATIKKWRALGYEGDMADLLIDACYKLQQGQEIPYSATLAEAARNAEMLAAKMFGG